MSGPFFGVQYLLSFLVLQSSRWGREKWLLYFNCLLDAIWLSVFCVSSSQYHRWHAVCDCGIFWSLSFSFTNTRCNDHRVMFLRLMVLIVHYSIHTVREL